MAQAAGVIAIAAQVAMAAYTGYQVYQSVTEDDPYDMDSSGAPDPWARQAEVALERGFGDYVNRLAADAPSYTQKYAGDIRRQYDEYHRRQENIRKTGVPEPSML